MSKLPKLRSILARPWRSSCRAGTAIAVLYVLAVVLAPASASAAWSGALRLSADDGVTDTTLPQVATDAAGDAIAAWFQKDPTTAGKKVVAYATRAPDGGWTSRGPISGAGEEVIASGAGSQYPVVLAEAPTGQALIAWVTGAEHGLAATTRTAAAGAFGPPVPITGGGEMCASTSTDDHVAYPTAALGAAGNGWIAWNARCAPDGAYSNNAQAYARSIQGGAFGTPLDAGTMASEAPALGVDPSTGLGVVAFVEEHTSPPPVTERTLSLLGAGGLGEPKQIASGVSQVGVTVGPAGEPISAWLAREGSLYVHPGEGGIYVRDSEGGAVRVSPAGQELAGADPQIPVVSSPDGTLVVAWRDTEGNVWAAVRHAGVWGAPQRLSDPGAEYDVHVAIAANDVAYVTWRREVSQFEGLEASVMDPGDPTRSPGNPWSFQPTSEVVADPAEGFLPSTFNSHVTGSALTVRPDGVATVALTWRNSLPNKPVTHVVGVIESTAPVGIGGKASGGGSGGGSSGTPAPGRDTRPPALTVFNATRTIFATGAKLDKKVAVRGDKTLLDNGLQKTGLRVGTVFKWTQSEAGKARLSIVYEGCQATLTAKKVNGYKICSRKAKDGVVVYKKTVAATRGANRLTYLGAAKKGRIPSGGHYIAKLVALDAAGNASKPKKLQFDVDAPLGR